MRTISIEEFQTRIEAGYETRFIEFKSGFIWNDDDNTWLKEKVIRAVLALTNTRGGGEIILGIREGEGHQIILEGMTRVQVASFEDYDTVAGYINSFSSNPIGIEILKCFYKNVYFIILKIIEFKDYPTLCNKDGKTSKILVKNDIYVRSLRAPFGSIKAGPSEIKEIIMQAADKERQGLDLRGYTKARDLAESVNFVERLKDL